MNTNALAGLSTKMRSMACCETPLARILGTMCQGVTDSTYTLVPDDEGKAFRVRVSFTDDAGFEESLTSALARLERPYGLGTS